MSYDLHIIRTEDWPNAAENPISFEEWIDHAHANDNLVEAGMLHSATPNGSDQPVFALAHGTSLHWRRGEVVATLADEADMVQLLPIAVALHGRVQGDDGEFYR